MLHVKRQNFGVVFNENLQIQGKTGEENKILLNKIGEKEGKKIKQLINLYILFNAKKNIYFYL